jgi:NodT family efflux transporter outer membrane factor (OMF) lipoprotein
MARPNVWLSLGLGAALLATGGCASLTRSTYSAPQLPVEAAWQQQAPGTANVAAGTWWDRFGDSDLSALVTRVVEANGDLAAAGIRLRQARLSADLAASQLFPSFNGSLSNGASAPLDGGQTSKSSSASLGASWEVDLFGRLDAERDAARWEAEATEKDLAATRLSLIGTTVRAWWQLAYVNERISLAEQSLDYDRKTYELVARQHAAGAVSRLDVREAEETVASQEAALTQLVQSRVETRNALAALLDRQVYDGPERQTLPREELPAVDAGIPAGLLARRPDLSASELRLRKTLATADATAASYYPQFSLTGSLGTASSSLLLFLGNPIASLGAALSLPVLNPDRIRLGTGIARADYDAAAAQFRQDVYDALRDTANALSAREQYVKQGEALALTLVAAQDAEVLYARQYSAGAVALRSLLDARERLRTAQGSAIENRLNQLDAQVSLYEALGGDAVAASRPG